MWRHLRLEKNIPLLLLFIFVLNLESSIALKGRWKPANEDARRFPTQKTWQNDWQKSAQTTTEHARRIQINRNMQNVRRNTVDRPLQNDGRFLIDRTSPNYRRHPVDTTFQNERFPIDRKLQNNRFPVDVKLQNNRFPVDVKLANARFPIDRKFQNARLPIDRTLPNDRFPIDKTLQNERRISTSKTLQNAERLEIDEQSQNDSRVSVVRTFPTDRGIIYDNRLQNRRIDVSDGIMQSDKKLNVNRLLEHNRRSQNELKNKIDMLLQNVSKPKDPIEPGGRGMPNFRQARNYLRERKTLEEHNQKILNSRRMQSSKRDWAATPHPIPRQGDQDKSNMLGLNEKQEERSAEFNSSEFIDPNKPREEEQGWGWGDFWKGVMITTENVAGLTPPGGRTLIMRTCYCIAGTYITAIQDFKKYYMWRYFYENNIQFEVGYLVAEIISKYQRMLEIFHMATDYFFKNQKTRNAHSTYVLYLYTNVLEMGTVIAHLCNMLTELEDKYKFIPVPQSGFTDYHLIRVFDDTESVQLANQILAYEKKMAKLRKEKIRERKKMRDKSLFIGMKVTTPDRRPKHRSWPLVYGWSIETDW
ncbi:hypothetical protein PYW08_008230 [Mythimna loreyi]|uniref:Uncharacterized protein n=1 Tax=Mythimna loreyi TaxID=667449 RepID=A0ACC2QET1_9NEOP|nr:hypothetical protein PYW08_008230 [Mythimna loreyi]